ncbi:MAG: tRNA (adenosine(37)-N6)-dimethylallyltransferase MiaA [Deltaproteobacteria bacterium]|nr:tRNA (adenosine(37)-N6)-dimethylallyltransferase MiaA [Deltaproteobacteria bacterium]
MNDAPREASGRIRVLDDALVDQIAAGEVVERPASIVKELLENAIDAEATTISVAIDGGGVGRIRVSDDGFGMTRGEAILALRRHATSKIATIEDLETIGTMGFRGEALPSIASVSRFRLTTRRGDAIGATEVTVSGGTPAEVREVGGAPGTTVEVKDLFHNVPARRKFLKSQATESAHVSDTCLRAALAHPGLRLTLEREGRRAREYLPAKSREARARAVFKDDLRAVAGDWEALSVDAYLGPPERARSGSAGLYIFVNRRPVKDRALARAVAFAYGSVLPPGRYPTGVVYIDVDPREIDVNVHPQKSEVRFARGRTVLDGITRTLASGLGTTAFGGPAARGPTYWNARLESSAKAPEVEGANADTNADPWGLALALRDGPAPYPASAPDTAGQTAPLLEEAGYFGSMRVLGQVRRMLIVCESEDGLHILDQHAADERIKYDGLRKTHERREVASQRLLFPERIEVSAAEAVLVEERRDEITRLGLDVAAGARRSPSGAQGPPGPPAPGRARRVGPRRRAELRRRHRHGSRDDGLPRGHPRWRHPDPGRMLGPAPGARPDRRLRRPLPARTPGGLLRAPRGNRAAPRPMSRPSVIVLAGPTAGGKTATAIALARALDGEVVGADSVQVYRGFDIGSAKPSDPERGGVPHHLIDVLDPDEQVDAMSYAGLADRAIREVAERGRLPIVVGGTGLWLRALLRGLVDLPPVDPELRSRLEAEAQRIGSPALHERLATVDPKGASAIHPNDALRVVRALEVFEQTGEALGELRARHALGAPRYPGMQLFVDPGTDVLRGRIDARTRSMIDGGFADEVRGLLTRYPRSARAFGSVGYRQMVAFVEGEATLEETAQAITQATRVYARRQRTWFRSEPGFTGPVTAEAVLESPLFAQASLLSPGRQ